MHHETYAPYWDLTYRCVDTDWWERINLLFGGKGSVCVLKGEKLSRYASNLKGHTLANLLSTPPLIHKMVKEVGACTGAALVVANHNTGHVSICLSFDANKFDAVFADLQGLHRQSHEVWSELYKLEQGM